MTFPAHDSPDDTAPQVAHPAATEALVTAIRALITTQRTADAPADVLEHATALVRDATALLAPHVVDGMPGQNTLRAAYPDREQFATGDPARFFPYSPVVGPLNPIAPPVMFTFDGERMSGAARSRRRTPVHPAPCTAASWRWCSTSCWAR